MPIARHTNELLNRLEQVIDVGYAELTDKELRRWYGMERTGVSVWRDIYARWMELHEDPQSEMGLMTRGTGHGYVFILANGLVSNNVEWVDIQDRARLSKGGSAWTEADAGSTVS